ESDVVVVGGGNAGLCAALTARESGASVTVLECAPVEYRGGESRHKRNMRCMTHAYTQSQNFYDLPPLPEAETQDALSALVIRESLPTTQGMKAYGVRFQAPLGGTLHLGRTNAFFLGGGKALMNAYYAAAKSRGIRILYNAEVTDLHVHDGKFKSGRILIN